MSKEYIGKAGSLYIVTKIKELLGKKVDKVEGKGLSTNDFTDTLKQKLDNIAEGANKTITDTAISSSSTNPLQNKVIYSELAKKAALSNPTFTGTPKAPTAVAGTNTTQIATTEFVTRAVADAIGSVAGLKFEVVTQLQSPGEANVIYLLSNGSGESQNVYDEYIWTGTAYEKIGTTSVDLSGYLKNTDMVEIENSEIDAMFA